MRMKILVILCLAIGLQSSGQKSKDQKITSNGYTFTIKTGFFLLRSTDRVDTLSIKEVWWKNQKIALDRYYGIPVYPGQFKSLRVVKDGKKDILIITVNGVGGIEEHRKFIFTPKDNRFKEL